MLSRDAQITVQHIPISRLHAHEVKQRYASMVMTYVDMLLKFPHDDAGYIRVRPCKEHPGMMDVEDGHHRLCASIIAGRSDMRCIIIEEPDTPEKG